MSRKIVILAVDSPVFDYEKEQFAKFDDVELIICPSKDRAEVLTVVKDAEVILFTDVAMDADFLAQLTNCKLIIRYGIGYDNIDTVKAAELGIMVCNAPNYGVIDVAEHAISLIFSCSRRLPSIDAGVRKNDWAVEGSFSRVDKKTIGYAGFGKIARCVFDRMKHFNTNALVYDPFLSDEAIESMGAKPADLDTLLAESDYVTLHVPLSEKTKHMFSMNEFKKMKNTAILINTGRGGLVKEADLVDALEQGIIGGAGLDVFENEFHQLDERLVNMPNVTLTPHVAWNTAEGKQALSEEVTNNVVRYLKGEKPESIVNMK